MKLGEWLKKYRKDNKMTMQNLADACGFSKAYLSLLEKGVNPQTGKPYSPTMQTFEKIARGTATDMDSLFKILDDDQPITLNPSPRSLSEEEVILVDNYRGLDCESKNLVYNMIRRLSGSVSPKSNTSLSVQKNGNNYGVVGGNFSAKVTIR